MILASCGQKIYYSTFMKVLQQIAGYPAFLKSTVLVF